jgi:hypothetical protein
MRVLPMNPQKGGHDIDVVVHFEKQSERIHDLQEEVEDLVPDAGYIAGTVEDIKIRNRRLDIRHPAPRRDGFE